MIPETAQEDEKVREIMARGFSQDEAEAIHNAMLEVKNSRDYEDIVTQQNEEKNKMDLPSPVTSPQSITNRNSGSWIKRSPKPPVSISTANQDNGTLSLISPTSLLAASEPVQSPVQPVKMSHYVIHLDSIHDIKETPPPTEILSHNTPHYARPLPEVPQHSSSPLTLHNPVSVEVPRRTGGDTSVDVATLASHQTGEFCGPNCTFC